MRSLVITFRCLTTRPHAASRNKHFVSHCWQPADEADGMFSAALFATTITEFTLDDQAKDELLVVHNDLNNYYA